MGEEGMNFVYNVPDNSDKDKIPFTFEILGPKEQFDVYTCTICGRNSMKYTSSQCMIPRTNFFKDKYLLTPLPGGLENLRTKKRIWRN